MNANTHEMFAAYRMTDATDVFAAAFTDLSKPRPTDPVRLSLIPADYMGEYLTISRKASKRGGGAVLRFRPSNTYKVDIRNRWGVVTLCTYGELVETLENMRAASDKPSKLNLGHAVEYKLCERWDVEWILDDTSHTVKGDITVDGVEYQVKWQGASL